MTKHLLTAAALALFAPAALADPVTKIVTIDTPKYEGTKTYTRDKEEGTFVRDTELTRKSDGATATREYDRQRTAHGYNAEGTLTRFNGQTYDYDAKVRRGEYRVGRSQVLRNSTARWSLRAGPSARAATDRLHQLPRQGRRPRAPVLFGDQSVMLAGTLPPFAASSRITALCSQMFISALPSLVPV